MGVNESHIRLRYSVAVNYLAQLYRIAVAVGFTIIVARRLSVEEFGLWGVVLSTSAMLSSATALWRFWAPRFIARGWREAAATCLALSLLYCAVGSTVYAALSYAEWMLLGWGLSYMLMGLPIFVLCVVNDGLEGAVSAVKPEAVGYRTFIYETLRIALALVLVRAMSLGLLGAVVSVEVPLALAALYMVFIAVRHGLLPRRPSRSLASQWLKAGYVPLMNTTYNFLVGGVRAFASWLTRSEVVVAYLNVGLAAQAPLSQLSRASALALYARLLRRPSPRDVAETLRMYFAASGFVTVTLIALSRSVASVFNPEYYTGAYLVVALVALYSWVSSLANVYLTAVLGASAVDRQGIASHRAIVRSPLFTALLARVLGSAAAYATSAALILCVPSGCLEQAAYVCLALLLASTATLIYMRRRARALVPHRVPCREALAAAAASAAALSYYLLAGAHALVIRNFWVGAPALLAHVTVAATIYLGVLLACSPWARAMLRESLLKVL